MSRHFTLIIPTRNRAETLRWSIQSCLSQDYDNMTVLVSDNCSEDHTQDVIRSFSDPRLRSVRTPAPTSMSANVEFALDQVLDQDTHITAFGDDDGLIPGGLAFADQLLDRHPESEVVAWMTSNYCWPDCLVADWRNNLQISLSDHSEVLQSAEMMAKLAAYTAYYHHLPGLWTAFVPAKLLREYKAKHGRVIFSPIPDAATAVLVGCLTSSYIFTQRSVTMLGSSSNSNGVAISQEKPKGLELFLKENTLPHHAELDFAAHGVYYVTESLMQARDLGLLPEGVAVDLARAVRLMLIRRSTDSATMIASIRTAAAATAARHGIDFDADALEEMNATLAEEGKLFADPVFTGKASILNHRCHPRLTPTIFQATTLAGEILGMNAENQVIRAEERQQLMNELTEKLQAAKEQVTKYRQRSEKLNQKLEAVKTAQAAKTGSGFDKFREKLRTLLGRQ